ncbi:MAG: GGDEF domain-containing protein [Candidatus Acidoferrales bacterium]
MSRRVRWRGRWRQRPLRQQMLVATGLALLLFFLGLTLFAHTALRLLALLHPGGEQEPALAAGPEAEALLWRLLYLGLFFAFLGIGAAVGSIRWVHRRLLEPLERLRESFDHREPEGALDPGVLSQPPELACLAERFQYVLTRAQTQAMRDPLTRLYNRRFAEETLQKLLALSRRTGRPFSLLLLDLDDLKAFNDRFGHAAGDRLLRAFARALQESLRRSAIPARWGGDEFLVILPEEDLPGARLLADRLRARTAEIHLEAPLRHLPLTVSIGLAACPQHGTGVEQLLQAADRALYQAKREGRNRVEVPLALPSAV